ncbi:MAG: serine/threonine protein kinase [Deltaproteobacteria bacterium]|nr:serine/threonine protein kinase [Deltaproteobacteria bacterium]
MPLCPRCLSRHEEGALRCRYDDALLVPEDQDPMIGSRLGNWSVGAFVAAGGMGRVYRGRHEALDRDVAIKVETAHDQDPETARERFVREARIASKIAHPNVVGVLDFGTTPLGLAYLVMEWVEGQTLSRVLLERGRLDAPLAATVARAIAAGLAAAHRLGFVHRDLKPGNVMLTVDGGVKVLDFGLARPTAAFGDAADALTKAGKIVGTPHYIAPEVVSGQQPADPRSDLYALGVVLYEMLSGCRPFSGKSWPELRAAQLHGSPEPLLDPGPLGLLALSLLDRDPLRRPPSAEDVARTIEDTGLALARWSDVPGEPLAPAAARIAPAATEPYPLGEGAAARGPELGGRSSVEPGTHEPTLEPTQVPTEPGTPPPPPAPLAAPRRVALERVRAAPAAPPVPEPTPPATRLAPRLRLGVSAALMALLIASGALLLTLSRSETKSRPLAASPPPPPPVAAVAAPSGVDPRAVHATPEDPPAPAHTPERPLPAKVTAPRPRVPPPPNSEDPRPDLQRALIEHGLGGALLAELEGLEGLPAALTAARARKDSAAEREVTSKIMARLDRADPEARWLKKRLAAVSSQLSAAKDKVPAERLQRFEDRYFDLAPRAVSGLAGEEYRALSLQIASLERELRVAIEAAGP